MLREYKAEDISGICQWVNDEATTYQLSTRFWSPQSMGDSEAYLNRVMQANHGSYHFVIADLADERYIGQIDMFRVDWLLRCGELGMVVGKAEERGKGVGAEALRLMERFAFQILGLERLELDFLMSNVAARRCYEKAGFVLEGVKRHAFFANGEFCDVGLMSILKEEWHA